MAENRFNSSPVECAACHNSHPNFSMLIHHDRRLLCHGCSTQYPERINTIRTPYKEFYYDLIGKLPTPDYSIAEHCLSTVETLKGQVATLLKDIQGKLTCLRKTWVSFLSKL